MFAQGDMAVYPAHGVGQIQAIETLSIAGKDQSFYVMRILKTDMTIRIPTSRTEGLRRIISADEVERVWQILKERDVELNAQTWNRRYREYMDKIKTGSAFEVAEVLRDLFLLRAGKDLSYGERKMMTTAMELLSKEISLARGEKEADVVTQIERLFA